MTALGDDELRRYARQIVLREIGGAGQVRLSQARVAVIGAGGIGCPALQALVGAGVGRIDLFDDDVVALDNLPRQPLFATSDVGSRKAIVAEARLSAINPHIRVSGHEIRIGRANIDSSIADADVVLDGCDNFATRLVVSDACTRLRKPLVSAAIGQFQGQIGTFRGWEVDQPCYRCFVGDAFDADDCDSCAELGVLGAMSAMIGNWAALEVVRAIVRFGPEAAGKVHIVDGVTPAMRTIRIVKDPACRGCGDRAGPDGPAPGPALG